jgi:hypothetical protein
MDVVFFSMKGTRTRGNRSNYYRKLLSEETLLDESSLQNAMLNRDYLLLENDNAIDSNLILRIYFVIPGHAFAVGLNDDDDDDPRSGFRIGAG